MIDELDFARRINRDLKDAVRMKQLNQELLEQLTGSIHYILKYSEKHNVTLQNKEGLIGLIDKANNIINRMCSDQPTFDDTKNNRRLDRTPG